LGILPALLRVLVVNNLHHAKQYQQCAISIG